MVLVVECIVDLQPQNIDNVQRTAPGASDEYINGLPLHENISSKKHNCNSQFTEEHTTTFSLGLTENPRQGTHKEPTTKCLNPLCLLSLTSSPAFRSAPALPMIGFAASVWSPPQTITAPWKSQSAPSLSHAATSST
jgi:hypothetical protein